MDFKMQMKTALLTCLLHANGPSNSKVTLELRITHHRSEGSSRLKHWSIERSKNTFFKSMKMNLKVAQMSIKTTWWCNNKSLKKVSAPLKTSKEATTRAQWVGDSQLALSITLSVWIQSSTWVKALLSTVAAIDTQTTKRTSHTKSKLQGPLTTNSPLKMTGMRSLCFAAKL